MSDSPVEAQVRELIERELVAPIQAAAETPSPPVEWNISAGGMFLFKRDES